MFAFTKKSDSSSPRLLRYLDFISQFSTNIRHISGSKNVVADTLSRIGDVHLPKVDFSAKANAQASDEELQALFSKNELSILLKPLSTDPTSSKLYCDIRNDIVRSLTCQQISERQSSKLCTTSLIQVSVPLNV
ncbi:hypothetical protein AVEN_230741-1 [Araneus ventricosus]|uniref:Reverse transcriptase RNase H-like domain-containing protein n=1 Tax=Araneus ventricosus TaxID=182803 RepID=A0A4Y2A319_ARAVE|nr:hypothetical protein AVEN_230741-1 [Araneus ventricosus]